MSILREGPGLDETREIAIKRMIMRSMRRGIKEMDLILAPFARSELAAKSDAALAEYDLLLSENDQDLYKWVSGQVEAPAQFLDLIAEIRKFALD